MTFEENLISKTKKTETLNLKSNRATQSNLGDDEYLEKGEEVIEEL